MTRQHTEEMVNEVFHRLFMLDRNSVSEKTQYPGTVLDFPLELSARETFNIMPRISKKTLMRIGKGAKSGNLDDMLTLSMMYTVGLGVPESVQHSMSWANFSTMNTGPLDFETAVEDLEDHLEEADGDFSYPAVVDKVYRSLIPAYEKVSCRELPSDTYLLSPLLAGLRLVAIYRVHRTDDTSYSYLYDVRVGGLDGDRLCLELANKLNLPNYIGSHGSTTPYKRLTHPDYAGFMRDYTDGDPSYFVVAGTLAIPSDLKPAVKRVLPNVKTSSDLFDYFLSTVDTVRKPIRNSSEYQNVLDSIAKSEARIKRIKSGEEYELLREQFADLKKEHKRAKRKEDFELAAELKEQSQKVKRIAELIKSGEAIPLLKNKVVKLKKTLESLHSSNEEYKADQYVDAPENFFQFVASDLYYGSKGKVTPMPMGQNINAHLSGFGFTVANVNMFDRYEVLRTKGGKLSGKRYDKAIAKFSEKFPEFKVTGLIARPVELGSVKKPQQLPVYIVTSE